MPKTRVLFVVNTVEFGGLEKQVLALINRFDPARVDCTILCYGMNFYSERLDDRPDVRVVSAGRDKSRSLLAFLLDLVRENPHIVVFEKGSMNSFSLGAYIAARICGARRLVAVEHLIADPVPAQVPSEGLWSRIRALAGWRTRYVVTHVWPRRLAGLFLNTTICVSTDVRQRLVNEYGFSPSKAVTVLNGIDLKYFDPANGRELRSSSSSCRTACDGPVIVCMSRLARRKRIDLLLEAFAMVLEKYKGCRCLIIGTGPEADQLRRRTTDLAISSSVEFVGFTEDVRPYLRISDIYVSSSIKEGLGVSIIEAMACGLPCVVTNIGGHTDVVAHGINGLLVEPESAAALADGLEYLITRPDERLKMGINGRRRAEELFDLETNVEKTKTLIFGDL